MDTNLTYCEDLTLSDNTRCDSPSILQVVQNTNVVDEVSMHIEELVKNDSLSTFWETPNEEINISSNNDVNKLTKLGNEKLTQDQHLEVNTDRYTHISQSQDNFIISNKFILSKPKLNIIQEETYSIEDEIPFSVIYTKKKIKTTRKLFRRKNTSKRIKELEFKQQELMTTAKSKHKYFLRPKKEQKSYKIETDTHDATSARNIKVIERKLNKKLRIDKKVSVNNEGTIEDEILLANNKKNKGIDSVTIIEETTKIKKERKRKNETQKTEESDDKVNIKTKISHDLELPINTLSINYKKTATNNNQKNEQQIQESDNKIIDLTESEIQTKLYSTCNKIKKTNLNKAGTKNKEQKIQDNNAEVKSNKKRKIRKQKPEKSIKKLNLEKLTTVSSTNKKPETKRKRKKKTKGQIMEESNNGINVETKTTNELEVPNKLLRTNHKKIETKNNLKRKDIEPEIQESNRTNVETNISDLEYNDPESNKIISSENFYVVREMNVINNSTANELDFSDFLPNSPFFIDRDLETKDLGKLDDFKPFSQNSTSFKENDYFSQPYADYTFNNYDTNFSEINIIEEVVINNNVQQIEKNNRIKTNTANVNSDELTLDIPLSLDLDTIDLVKSNEVPYSQNSFSLSELEYLSQQDFTEKNKETLFKNDKTLVNSNNNGIDICNIDKAKSINLSIEITNSNIPNVASKRKVRVSQEKYKDFTESQVENITFKVLEELSNVKNYLYKREKIFESSGSRYNRYPIGTFNSGSQNSNFINESAHCLLQHITSSALVTHTEHITRQISIVLGNLIDKLHEEENYPNFLEKLLESVDNLLNYIYTGDNYEEYMLLKKEQAINRFFLLNRSSHIIQYSIQKIIKILQETLENIKLGDFELKHTDKAENICHIFNILEVLLNRHTKLRKNLSQHSSQMSQDDRVIKKSALTEIWRKKWNLSKNEVCEGSSQNNNFLTECSDVLNKITIEAMDGHSLMSFAALQCYNLLQ